MKKYIFLFLITTCASGAIAQLADGTTAPDFTFTDINGVTRNLYTYLDQGKYVAIDISATWCSPCWAYHQTGSMDSLFTLHDTPGDNIFKVLFIEGDGGTDLADLQGTGSSTTGNWILNTLFPIINPPAGVALNDFKDGYNITSFPIFYLICPDRKVYTDTLNSVMRKPSVSTWEYVANMHCSPVSVNTVSLKNDLVIYPNPAEKTMMLKFSISSASQIKLKVTNVLGQLIEIRELGLLSSGDHSVIFDVNNYSKGLYFITLLNDHDLLAHKKVVIQ